MAKIRPNEPCPCGSGKKHKRCCLPKLEQQRAQEARRNRDDGSARVRLLPAALEALAPALPEGARTPEDLSEASQRLVALVEPGAPLGGLRYDAQLFSRILAEQEHRADTAMAHPSDEAMWGAFGDCVEALCTDDFYAAAARAIESAAEGAAEGPDGLRLARALLEQARKGEVPPRRNPLLLTLFETQLLEFARAR